MARARAVVAGILIAMLVASGCAEAEDPGSARSSSVPSPTASSPAPVAASPQRSPHPVSLPALFEKDFDGRDLRLGDVLARTDTYVRYQVTYRSGRLRISGVLNVPHGSGPFPALVLAHGYIDPAVYRNGQGMRREQDWLARAGYVVLHTDYRHHAESSKDPSIERDLRLGYTEDVINAVHALRQTTRVPVDDGRIGLVGRSMGGGVVYNVISARPGLVDAAVVFAPVSSLAAENFDRWIRPDPDRGGLARALIRRYGDPADGARVWREVSPRSYFDRITEPVLIHHGTSDDSCPIRWSRQTAQALESAGVDVTLRIYPGEEHAFGAQWPLSMRRTVAFLEGNLV